MAGGYKYFEAIEKNAVLLGILTLVMVSLGGLSEITPLFVEANAVGPPRASSPTIRCASPARTSTCARAAISATRR